MQEFDLQTTAAVIDALGGNPAVGDLTGSNAKAVWNWRSSNSFPANTYVAIMTALRAQGMRAPDSLWAMKLPAPHPETAA